MNIFRKCSNTDIHVKKYMDPKKCEEMQIKVWTI